MHPDGAVYTKIDHVCDMAATLPLPPHGSYVLVDSRFTCARVIDSYATAGYHLIGGLKTNQILYPQGIRISVKDFAIHIRKEDARLVTVNGTSYWTYRYGGALNDMKNAIVLCVGVWRTQGTTCLFVYGCLLEHGNDLHVLQQEVADRNFLPPV